MKYTKEEFEEVVKRFNEDKERFGWTSLANKPANCGWDLFKQLITNYPSYYEFESAREFKYWLSNSESSTFISERFCPICGEFIEVQECGFQGKYKVACNAHLKEVRMQNVQNGVLKKYGVTTIGKAKEVQEKVRRTNLEKYGVERPLSNKKIHEKTIESGLESGSYKAAVVKVKQTKKERYGDENYNNGSQISETKLNTPESVKREIREKTKATLKERYGSDSYNNPESRKKTNLERYGVENVFHDKEVQDRAHALQRELLQSDEIYKDGLTYAENYAKKCYETKKRNKTFATSKIEDELYAKLAEKFGDVKRQYRSATYPYACDYYVPRNDLYVELQAFPSHGGHPFDPNDPKDLEKLEDWKQKSQEINFKGVQKKQYENYIEIWTIRDPEKRRVAKENGVNLLEIFPADFDYDVDQIVLYIEKMTLQIRKSSIKYTSCERNEGDMAKEIDFDTWRQEEVFGVTKGHCLNVCLNTPFPGTAKWPAENPIWDCTVANNISPKEAYSRPEYLVKAIDNLYWIINKSIRENKYEDFLKHQEERMHRNDVELIRVIINRFTIAKIAPKVTALMPSKFLQLAEDTGIDLSSGVYCPMAGFGGIIEGAKRWFIKHGMNPTGKIEAYDINQDFCDYFGWIQKDVLAEKVKTDKIVFVCPPFGLKTERWPGTPLERDDEFGTNYLDFHDWCLLIREYVDAPNYIFVGPEESGIRPNKNITSGLFTKQFGIRWYPEYSNL